MSNLKSKWLKNQFTDVNDPDFDEEVAEMSEDKMEDNWLDEQERRQEDLEDQPYEVDV